jgi:hypothetical protein
MINLIQWSNIKARNFEKFVYSMLGYEGFKNLKWFGKGGGDEGRDIIATRYEELPFNLGYERKWIFQCKKWAKMPTSNKIINEIATASQHNPDFWVLVIPVDPTSSMIDFFERIEQSYRFKIILIPLAAIEGILHKYPRLINLLENGHLPIRREIDA